MTETPLGGLDIHFVEPGGRGGVFQHTAAVARELAQAGNTAVIHTAPDHESGSPGVSFCGCVQWARRGPRAIRRLATGLRFAAGTTRHLVEVGGSADIVHVQGWFHPLLTARLVERLRPASALVAFTPHNTFSRKAGRRGLGWIMEAARAADLVFVFSPSDHQRMAGNGVASVVIDLHLDVPDPALADVVGWREAWGDSRVALMPGNLRADKDPELFVASLALLPGVRGVAVGADAGGVGILQAASRRWSVPVQTHVGYQERHNFVAAIAAADVIVLPYAQASSSAVATLARGLGTPVVASAIGGLAAQASHPVGERSPEGFAAAIASALAEGRLPPRVVQGSGEAHLAAYAAALAPSRRSEPIAPR